MMNETMREAMRLMQKGDLLAATAAIQHRLGGAAAAEASTAERSSDRSPIEGTCRVVDEIPLVTEESSPPAPFGRVWSFEERTHFSEHIYTGSAGSRHYKLFIPSTYHGQPLPLVVMLHGCSQTPDDFATGTRMNRLAQEHSCFVVYPAQPKTANMSKCWNWFEPSNQRRDEGEPAIIAGMVRELLRTYGLDSERVYVGGLSAGAAMAVILGRAYPELFAAVGVHSGLPYAAAHDLPSAFAAMHQQGVAHPNIAHGGNPQPMQVTIPTIVFHGDRDITVHPSNGERVVNQSAGPDAFNAGNSSDATAEEISASQTPGARSHTRRIFRDGDGKVIVEYWLVHGAAHAWFGGDPRGSYTDIKGPDASREMIRFFLERKRAPND